MNKYNYREAIANDVKEYLNDVDFIDGESQQDFVERIHDDMFVADSVTGNSSGSYTYNSWLAEEYICHNMDLLQEAFDSFCFDLSHLWSAEFCDVTIRCYLLGEVAFPILEEYYNNNYPYTNTEE